MNMKISVLVKTMAVKVMWGPPQRVEQHISA